MAKSVVQRITRFNKDREPGLVKLKYEALKENPFRFFRGTCHLFYEDIPRKSFILRSPHTWICGDLHLENFGSFKGDNRVPYFDINDFDEALLAPCLLDVVRLCTSLFLASGLLKISRAEAKVLTRKFVRSYSAILSKGYIRSVEKATARGVVKQFLNNISVRKRKELLAQRIRFHGKKVAIKHDLLKSFKASKKIRDKVAVTVIKWAKKNADQPDFFKVVDIAIRATGTGSIGLERYLAAVAGKGVPGGLYLVDIKEARPPVALQYLKLKQPAWKNEAERLIAVQRRVQGESPAFLNAIKIGGKDFVMKELQPLEDKVDFRSLEKDPIRIAQLVTDMGAILAWDHLRASGRQGAAIADDLMKFGRKMDKMENNIIRYSMNYADVTTKYWKDFKK